MISDIIQALKDQLGTSLPEYTEVPFFFNPDKNLKGALEKGYWVRALGGQQTVGSVRDLTITRDFGLTLTREYHGNLINDTVIFDRVVETLEDAELFYRAIAQTNLNGNVLNVHSLRSEDPLIDNDNKNIQIPIIFSLQYRERV